MEIDRESLKWSNPYKFKRFDTRNKPYEHFFSDFIENTSFRFNVYEQFVPAGERTGVYSIEVVDGLKHVASVARFIAEEGWNGHRIMQTINLKCKTWIDLELPKFIKEKKECGWNEDLVKQMENERIQYYEDRKELIKKILREHGGDDVTCVIRDTKAGKFRIVEGELSLADLDLGYFTIKDRVNGKSTQFDIDDIKCFSLNDGKLYIFMKGSNYE